MGTFIFFDSNKRWLLLFFKFPYFLWYIILLYIFIISDVDSLIDFFYYDQAWSRPTDYRAKSQWASSLFKFRAVKSLTF